MNDTNSKVLCDFQQNIATAKVFHCKHLHYMVANIIILKTHTHDTCVIYTRIILKIMNLKRK